MNVLKPEFVSQDSRRILSQLLTADIKQVNHYEAKRGAVLGNHYHKQTNEYFFIISEMTYVGDIDDLHLSANAQRVTG